MKIKKINIESIPSKLQTSVFNSRDWLSIYGNKISIHGIFNDNQELIGYFSTQKVKQLKLLSHTKNPTFSPNCGLIYINPAQNKAKKHSFNKKLTKLVSEYLSSIKTNIITLSLPPDINDTQAFYWDNYKVIPHYTYYQDLNKSYDDLFKCLEPKARSGLKKAEKDGLTFKQNKDYKIVKDFVINTMSKNKVAIDEKILDKILFEYSNKSNSFSYISSLNQDVLAMAFCVYFNGTCHYIFGGYNDKKTHPSAGPLCVWQSMLHAKEIGIKTFDFEGSMLIPVEKYFRSFGAELTPYYTLNKANYLIESLLKFKKRSNF